MCLSGGPENKVLHFDPISPQNTNLWPIIDRTYKKYGVTGDPLFTGREGVTWPTFQMLGPPPYLENGWS